MGNRMKFIYVGLAAICFVLATVWITHEPTASINKQESSGVRKNQLTKQTLSVPHKEPQLTKNTSVITQDLPNNLLMPEIGTNPLLYPNQENWPSIQIPYIKSSIGATKSKNPMQNAVISLPTTNPTDHFAERKLDFDLSYFLMIRIVDPASEEESLKPTLESFERWISVHVKAGDSLSVIFNRLKLDPQLAIKIARQNDATSLNNLRVGDHLEILIKEQKFLELRYEINSQTILTVAMNSGQYDIYKTKRKFDVTQRIVTGVIESSLFESGINDGLDLDLLYELSSIFQWKIDFNRDLRAGDRYTLIYEERSLDEKKFSSGPILAADLTLNGKQFRAIRHTDKTGRTQYFTPDGESLEGLFLRSPMKISRVTSRFTNRRFHPVLKEWRAHKGVDYGGITGDPVMATGDGVISFLGWKGNYGRTIIIQHGKKYSTLYAHLSKFAKNMRAGREVNQSQIIGYLGSSGLTTGPHLHYEFRVNGVHKNPLTVKLPRTFAIDRASRPVFFENARSWTIKLNRAQTKTNPG